VAGLSKVPERSLDGGDSRRCILLIPSDRREGMEYDEAESHRDYMDGLQAQADAEALEAHRETECSRCGSTEPGFHLDPDGFECIGPESESR
jgi:hypothetical protein